MKEQTVCSADSDCKDNVKSVVELSEYSGEKKLTINCTQLGDSFTPQFKSQKEKKRVLNEWIEFLETNPDTFEELNFGTRMPQELFDAVCCQKRLKKLHVKWGAYKDISAIEQLKNIENLYIGSGAGVESIIPLTKLNKIVALSIENFQKITDYSLLGELTTLKSLCVEGDGLGPQYIKVDSLDFLKSMTQLRSFRFLTARLQSKNYSPVLSLVNLEDLTLIRCREVSRLYDELIKLPKLQRGLLVERPDLYKKEI